MTFNAGIMKGKLIRLFRDRIMDGGVEIMNENTAISEQKSQLQSVNGMENGDASYDPGYEGAKDNVEEGTDCELVGDDKYEDHPQFEEAKSLLTLDPGALFRMVARRNGEDGKMLRCPYFSCPITAMNIHQVNFHLASVHDHMADLVESISRSGSTRLRTEEAEAQSSIIGESPCQGETCTSTTGLFVDKETGHEEEHINNCGDGEDFSKEYIEQLREDEGNPTEGMTDSQIFGTINEETITPNAKTRWKLLAKSLEKINTTMEVVKKPVTNIEYNPCDAASVNVHGAAVDERISGGEDIRDERSAEVENKGEIEHIEEISMDMNNSSIIKENYNEVLGYLGSTEYSGEDSLQDNVEDVGNLCEDLKE